MTTLIEDIQKILYVATLDEITKKEKNKELLHLVDVMVKNYITREHGHPAYLVIGLSAAIVPEGEEAIYCKLPGYHKPELPKNMTEQLQESMNYIAGR